MRRLLKKIAVSALGNPIHVQHRLKRLRASDCRVVLNLHRLSLAATIGDALDAELFDELLAFLQKEFELTTFEGAACMERSPRKPIAILSFDDGYKDFVEVAAPLMRKRRIRCNQNVIPECIALQRPPLNVLVQDFICQAPSKLIDELKIPGFDLHGPKQTLGRRISSFLKNKPFTEQQALADVLLPQLYGWEPFRPTGMMTLREVQQMAVEHEIGAHSYSHASMAHESDDYLANDIHRCRQYFHQELGTDLRIYAFPNGSCTDRQIEMLEQAQIRHVLLVGEQFDCHPTRHFRFTFHASSVSEVKWRATGGFAAVTR